MNCERLIENDNLISTKDEETDRLKACIRDLEEKARDGVPAVEVPTTHTDPVLPPTAVGSEPVTHGGTSAPVVVAPPVAPSATSSTAILPGSCPDMRSRVDPVTVLPPSSPIDRTESVSAGNSYTRCGKPHPSPVSHPTSCLRIGSQRCNELLIGTDGVTRRHSSSWRAICVGEHYRNGTCSRLRTSLLSSERKEHCATASTHLAGSLRPRIFITCPRGRGSQYKTLFAAWNRCSNWLMDGT